MNPVINNPEQTLKSISKVAGWLWSRRWAEWGAGNLSVNVTGLVDWSCNQANDVSEISTNQSLHLLTSVSGSKMRNMMTKPENSLCLVIVDEHLNRTAIPLSGQCLPPSPTSEFDGHLLIHQTLLKYRPEHKSVLHTHPAEIIALSEIKELRSEEALNKKLNTILPELKIYLPEGIAFVPFHEAGSMELAKASAAAIKDYRVAIWEKHGIIATGTTLEDAFDAIDLVVKAARIWFLIRSVE